jgi:hypothetical protein
MLVAMHAAPASTNGAPIAGAGNTPACTCPPGRNSQYCLVHRAPFLAAERVTPIWVWLAWDSDLNWCGDARLLFWQHDRIPGWEF